MILGQRREVGTHGAPHPRGQSIVEFALVLPILLLLLLGAADFGRVFAAGLLLEGSARDAAEAVAHDGRMAQLKNPGCNAACRAPLYAALHEKAAGLACDEARRLDASLDSTGGTCAGRLLVAVCIRDSVSALPFPDTTNPGDPSCGETTGGTVPRPGCDAIDTPAMSNLQTGPAVAIPGGTSVPLRSVEVRLCYRFTPFITQLFLPFASYEVSQVYLHRERVFIVSADY